MTITKDHIIESVQRVSELNRPQAKSIVESLIEIIKSTLQSGEDVLLSGFGKFCVKDKGERKGRNPATGKEMMLRRRRVVTFQCSSVLRDKINGGD